MNQPFLFSDLHREPLVSAPALPQERKPTDARKLARTDGSISSKAAAEAIVTSGAADADCERLLAVLKLRPIFNYELGTFAGLNGRARVSDLRARGFVIENTRVKRDGKATSTTMYRLVSGPGVEA